MLGRADTTVGTGKTHGVEAKINSIQMHMAALPVVWVTLDLILDFNLPLVGIMSHHTEITGKCITSSIQIITTRTEARHTASIQQAAEAVEALARIRIRIRTRIEVMGLWVIIKHWCSSIRPSRSGESIPYQRLLTRLGSRRPCRWKPQPSNSQPVKPPALQKLKVKPRERLIRFRATLELAVMALALAILPTLWLV